MRVLFALLYFVLTCTATSPMEARLDRQMRLWQRRLGLDEWSMTLQVVRKSEMEDDAWGASQWDPQTKTAVIQVLDPRDYNLRGSALRQDMECTIVHELVHIQVSPIASGSGEEREAVVNGIMTALLNRSCPN